jgi:hypothetical protein
MEMHHGRVEEVDAEGLSVDNGWLWIAGSHSCNRKKLEEDDFASGKALSQLAKVEQGANRFFLGRIPLGEDGTGRTQLVKVQGDRKAGRVAGNEPRGPLFQELSADVHFGPFLKEWESDQDNRVRLPSKENGLDIEGLAVRGDRVFLGLRGPVFRDGWACIWEWKVEADAAIGSLSLMQQKTGGPGEETCLCLKHFVNLGGLGIRDLEFDGDDLLILVGPNGDADGEAAIYRWRGALEATGKGHTVSPRDATGPVFVLAIPTHGKEGHPEGITLVPNGGSPERRLFVVCDGPGAAHIAGETAVRADVYILPD